MDKQIAITLIFRDQATAQVQATVSKIGGALKGMAASATAATTTVIGGFTNMATKVGGAIVNFMRHATLASLFIGGTFVASMGAAVNMAAKFERFGKAAEFLTGSTNAAKEFAKAVREVAVQTMFNVDEIAEMESRLIGNTRNVQLSTKTLKALADAVAATGGSYTELEASTRAWIQINARGKASSEELNRQFANANIPIVRLLGESILKDVNHPLRKYVEVAKEAEKGSKGYEDAVRGITAQLQNIGELDIPGAIAAEAVTRALEEAYGGANQTLIQTFAGRLSMLKDVLKLSLLSFLGLDESFKIIEGGLFDLLSKGLKPMVEWLQKNQDAIAKFGREIGGSLPFIAALAGILIGAMLPALIFIFGKVVIMAAVFGGLGAAVGFVVEKLGGFKNIIDTVKGIIDTVRDALGFLSEKFTEIKDKIEKEVNKKLEELHEWYKKHEVAILILSSVITTFFLPALAMVAAQALIAASALAIQLMGAVIRLGMQFFITALGAMASFIWHLGVIIISAGTHAVFALIGLTIATIKYGLAGWAAVFAMMTWIIQLGILTAQQLFAAATTTIVTIATWSWTAAIWALNAALAVLTSPIFLIIIAIIALVAIGWWLIAHWDTVKAKAIEVWNSIKQWISDTVEGSKIIIQEKWNAIKKWLSDTWEGIKTTAGDVWKKIGDAIIGPIKDVIDWFDKAISKAEELISKGAEIATKKAKGFWPFQHGGIVPGPVGSPVPIMAHGGERVIPRGSNTNAPFANAGGGGTTINFYGNLTVDSEDRVKQLADTIAKMLGRQNELARWGVGY